MNSKNEIINFLQKNKNHLVNAYHIKKIGLFGSFARDEQTKESDVDLLVEFENDIKDIYDTKQALNLFLSNAFHRSVDIAREKYLKPYAKDFILKDTIYV